MAGRRFDFTGRTRENLVVVISAVAGISTILFLRFGLLVKWGWVEDFLKGRLGFSDKIMMSFKIIVWAGVVIGVLLMCVWQQKRWKKKLKKLAKR
jgi:hypothetical protein